MHRHKSRSFMPALPEHKIRGAEHSLYCSNPGLPSSSMASLGNRMEMQIPRSSKHLHNPNLPLSKKHRGSVYCAMEPWRACREDLCPAANCAPPPLWYVPFLSQKTTHSHLHSQMQQVSINETHGKISGYDS